MIMRITFILDIFKAGGKQRRCFQTIQGLVAYGYKNIQLIIFNEEEVGYPEVYELGVEVEIINRKGLGKDPFQVLKDLDCILGKYKPDVVQCWGLVAMPFVCVLKLKYRYYLIGAYVANSNSPKLFSIDYFVNLLAHVFANKFISNSIAGLSAYRIPKKKGVVIYNGFNPERYQSAHCLDDLKNELKIKTKYVVTMIARFHPSKDYETYFRVADEILSQRRDITFIAAGRGDKTNFINKISQENRTFIIIRDFMNDIERLICNSNVSILLTNFKVHGEGVSNSIMESMAFGVPVIATQGGGNPEIVEDGSNGFLIPNNDIAMIKNRLLNLIDNMELWNSMSRQARYTIENRFMLKNTVEEYVKLYGSIGSKQ
jgi:glycosyltransferase involved in cell wall biosynthesis